MAQQKPAAWQSIVAGGAAGGLESLITYPTEFVKTRQQLSSQRGASNTPFSILLSTLKHEGVRPMYTGVGVFCLSNASKSAVRFTTFDLVRSRLPLDPVTGKPHPLSNMLAGACAGAAESLTVLTPGENLKTKLIDSGTAKSAHGRPSATQLVSRIVADEGVRGLYRGVLPVTMKQSANSVVRFTSYQYLLEGTKLLLSGQTTVPGAVAPAIAGGAAGIVTVYATMPFDNVKTKMQALEGGVAYRGSLHCLQEIMRKDGVKGLWKGTSPRLIRLTVSGTIAFSIYEQVIALTSPRRHQEENMGIVATPA